MSTLEIIAYPRPIVNTFFYENRADLLLIVRKETKIIQNNFKNVIMGLKFEINLYIMK